MKLKTKLISTCGDNYLICDLRVPYESAELQNALLRYKGIYSVFLHPSHKCDTAIKTYEFPFDPICVSAGALLCTARYLFNVCSAGRLLHIAAETAAYQVEVDTKRITLEMALPVEDREYPTIIKEISSGEKTFYIAQTMVGCPHIILFCEEIEGISLVQTAGELKKLGIISSEMNLVIARLIDPANMKIRIFHNQVREMAASGNAAVAAGIAAVRNGMSGRSVCIQCSGGCYKVYFPPEGQSLTITGEAKVIGRIL